MNAPKVLTVCETHAGGRHLATVTMQVPIEDLPELLYATDHDDAKGGGLDQALASAKVAGERRDAERKLEQARDDADAAAAAAAALEQTLLASKDAGAELAIAIATPATSADKQPPEEPAAAKPPAPTGETLLGLALAKDPMH